MTQSRLPRFQKPPVREALLGIQFKPLGGLGPFEVAELLKTVSRVGGDAWHQIDARPAIGQLSLDGQAWTDVTPSFPPLRATIRNGDRSRLLQLENGWLTLSWTRREPRAHYPGYEALQSELRSYLSALEAAISDKGEAPLAINFWEFTYVNSIPAKGAWMGPSDWHTWFPGLLGPLPHLAGRPAGCVMQTISIHADFDGRLEVNLERQDEQSPGVHHDSQGNKKGDIVMVTPALSVRITAQGRIGPTIHSWEAGMCAGHEHASMTFLGLLSDSAKVAFGLLHA